MDHIGGEYDSCQGGTTGTREAWQLPPADVAQPVAPRARRWRRRDLATAMVVIAAALAVVADVAVDEARESPSAPAPAATGAAVGRSATAGSLPGGSAAYSRSGWFNPARTRAVPGTQAQSSANTDAVSTADRQAYDAAAKAVTPGIVDIVTTLPGATGAGTGIVLSSTGEVLTNNHVIDGATSIKATDLATGVTYPATVVGYDPGEDIAILQLTGASGLPTAKLSTAAATVGESVIGVGNAEGLGGAPSWAAGTITATGRSITATDEDGGSPETVGGLLQSTAPIQPGDSGGPLVDTSGSVVGMDTAGSFSGSGTAASAAFAIPIAHALSIAKAIESGQGGSGVHLGATPALGVAVAPNRVGGNSAGVQIAGATAGGPAAAAGLVAGDTVTSIDDTPIRALTDLTAVLLAHRPGDAVHVDWITADGTSHSATLHLGTGSPQ